MSNIEPEEAQAIAEMTQPDPIRPEISVEPRDFREPIRLSPTQLARLRREITQSLSVASKALSIPLRQARKLELGDLLEVDGNKYFATLAGPFLCVRLDCNGREGWATWDVAAAARAADVALSGSTPDEPQERKLSPIECGIIEKLLVTMLEPLSQSLGMTIVPTRTWQDLDDVRRPDDSDMQRLLLHVTIDGPGDPSELSIYLPGIGVEASADESASTQLPEHLEDVDLELRAFVGSADIPLDELLKLEIGDVIPLGTPADGLLDLYAEERAFARASWGRHGSHLAVRVEQIELHPNEINQPSSKEES